MLKRALPLVVLVIAAGLTWPARGNAAEARMYFSRRGPTNEGCLGPTAGEVPYVEMPGGGVATLHLWLNVDGLSEDESFRELGWGVEYTSSYDYFDSPLIDSEVANPLNPTTGESRWNAVLGEPAAMPYLIYRAGGESSSSPSIGTTDVARLDGGYDAASNSFHLGSITVDTFGHDQFSYYLRNGRLTQLKSGEPIDLLFGDSDLAHSGATPDQGDPIAGSYRDAFVVGSLRRTDLGIYAASAAGIPPAGIERRIDLASGPGSAAYCARGEWYGRVAIENYHRHDLEIYVDFASASGAEVAERLFSLGFTGDDVVDVSGTYPLRNGIDYDVRLRLDDRPPGESFVLWFDTEFDFPGYPVANIGIVPEPSSVALATIGCLAAAALSRRRRFMKK
ncbi:MAG: PEP-CTERM sorting domain-containing protein [Pirellulales bacterium]